MFYQPARVDDDDDDEDLEAAANPTTPTRRFPLEAPALSDPEKPLDDSFLLEQALREEAAGKQESFPLSPGRDEGQAASPLPTVESGVGGSTLAAQRCILEDRGDYRQKTRLESVQR
jgi:hypothetical protein